ncbi:MAG: ribulose-phosphate 3-epimerase [Rikenellaceae bacterium]
MHKIISPSLLSANFGHLDADVEMLNSSEAEWLHLDIMDGVFVPNISFGFSIINAIRKKTTKVLDTHLMIVDPERYVEDFAKAGADILTVHIEALKDPKQTIAKIKECGMKAGLSIKPATSAQSIFELLPMLDMVLVMSVEPGFGGQKFMPESLDKIKALRAEIDRLGLDTIIEIDGGIDLGNAAAVYEAGCEVLVAGSTVFNSSDPKQTIHELLKL